MSATLLEKPAARRAIVATLHREADAIPGARHVAALRRDTERLWRPVAPEMHVQFRALGAHIASVVPAMGGLVLESRVDVRRRVEAILAAAGVTAWIKTRFSPIYERMYKKVGTITAATLTRERVPVTKRDKIESRMIREGGKRLGLLDINKQTKESLFRIVDVGRELGLNPNQTAEMIRDMVPKGRYVNAGSTYRAEMIARSEVLHGQRIASLEAYRHSSAVEMVIAFDGDGDAICFARNGTRMTIEQAESAAYGTHPQCVLAFGPVTR